MDEQKTPEMLSMLDLNEEQIEQLSEHLAVIQEVREELSKSYIETTNLKKTNESLSADMANKEKNIEMLTKELNALRARDAEVERLNRMKKLEQLSANFKRLGQEKSIEELSKLDNSILNEFDAITKMALNKKDTESLDAVTVPTQAMAKPKADVKVEQLRKTLSFKDISVALTAQQSK